MQPNYLNCWKCDGYLGIRPYPFTQRTITGFFGPPWIECKWCGAFTKTENLEWPELTLLKQRFVLLGCIVFCIVIVSSFAFLIALLVERQFHISVATQVAIYLITYAIGAAATVAWQIRSISESVRRYDTEKKRAPVEDQH